jgi:organic hydroperoxide reductase OsmC/OhrA
LHDLNIDTSSTHATVTKHISTTPRRISEIEVTVYLNQNLDNKTQTILEKAALTCPIAQSQQRRHKVF